jgi:hypothetical protein
MNVNEFEEIVEIEKKRSSPETDSSGNVSRPLGNVRERALVLEGEGR